MIVERRAARVLLIANRSVLLIQGVDPGRPDRGPWWFTPGGGIEADEPVAVAAVREVLEETGLHLDAEQLGAVIATRVAQFEFDGRQYRQEESFFAVAVEPFAPERGGWDDVERRALLDHRWWTVDELEATLDVVYPNQLATLVRAVLAGPVDPPLRLSGA